MTEFKWCKRCGGESFGKEFCMDCRDRLEQHKEYKDGYEKGDLLRKLGINT